MQKEKLKRTPLYDQHLTLNARMVPFAGYEMPVQYTGILEEALATRSAGGLFDVSHMGQFRIQGNGGLEALNRLVTNDLKKMRLGQAQYNMLCNPSGGVIDDLVVYFRGEKDIYLCVNASNREADFKWMKEHLPPTVKITDESEETALIALQGPIAENLLNKAGAQAENLKYYWAQEAKIFSKPCYLSRTGYTGEDGFELYLPAKYAPEIWGNLLEQGKPLGLKPVGLGARDTLRMEMGYPLHGHELSPLINPLEANLGWVVKLQKTDGFIGQAVLKKIKESGGPEKTLVGLTVEDRRLARQGYEVMTADKRTIGTVSSGTQSPHVNAPIALAFINKQFATAEKLYISVRNELIPARVTPLPFTPSHTKKEIA